MIMSLIPTHKVALPKMIKKKVIPVKNNKIMRKGTRNHNPNLHKIKNKKINCNFLN